MLLHVLKQVDQRIAHLSYSPQLASIEAIPDHPASTPPESIETLRNPDSKPFHPPAQRLQAVGLTQQMQMIALHRPLNQSHPEALAPTLQSTLHHLEGLLAPQRRQPFAQPHGDVQRVPRVEFLANAMLDTATRLGALATRALSPPTM